MNLIKRASPLLPLLIINLNFLAFCQPIDRWALVSRHNVKNTSFDSLETLSVGNGKFAFSVDFTGLQTFPEEYKNGVPLGTMSEWGWHSFPNKNGYRFEETFENYEVHGRKIPYAIQKKSPQHATEASDYFRSNPHRLHLGIVGFHIVKPDGSEVNPEDFTNINQELDLWSGEIRSTFKVLNEPVEVITFCHPEEDKILVRVKSNLVEKGALKIHFNFPYPTGAHSDMAAGWQNPEKHSSVLYKKGNNSATIERNIDSTRYYTEIQWEGKGFIESKDSHLFELSSANEILEVSFLFSPAKVDGKMASFEVERSENQKKWSGFWLGGGAVDLSGSSDPRAHELERRIVLSQYLTAIQCAGNYPPQETGLTYNSWYGKFHLEMVWWHVVHYALWNRIEWVEKIMPWYVQASDEARQLAKKQGYEGVRWQKMTDPSGAETSSSVGSFLIWQQPHYIYFAELIYRHHQDSQTLAKYKDLVFETADFMASYAWKNPEDGQFDLGPVLIPAQECFNPLTTINPPLELAYWHWGLVTAEKWAERLKIKPNPKWKEVREQLSPLYEVDELYVPAESTPNAYKKGTQMIDHPAVFGALGMFPETPLVDPETMQRTFDFIWENWHWDHTWGWDFPLTAMTATRLGQPEKAIEALLMDVQTNTYLSNGHNFQDDRLRLYLPGNGGLLAAVAMMCAGFDGCTTENPGFPKDGSWKVKWEGLVKTP